MLYDHLCVFYNSLFTVSVISVKYRCTDLFHQLPLTLVDNKLTDLQLLQLVKGYQQLHQADLLEQALGYGKDIHAMAVELLDAVFEVWTCLVVLN